MSSLWTSDLFQAGLVREVGFFVWHLLAQSQYFTLPTAPPVIFGLCACLPSAISPLLYAGLVCAFGLFVDTLEQCMSRRPSKGGVSYPCYLSLVCDYRSGAMLIS